MPNVKGSKYTDNQRESAAVQYAVSGNMKAVSKAVGIPRSTLIGWRDTDWWTEIISAVINEKREQHIAQYTRIVDKAQSVTLAKLDGSSASQASLIACQATDKAQLLAGLPTSISSNHDNRAMLEVCKELSRTMRNHGVVSVQAKSKIK